MRYEDGSAGALADPVCLTLTPEMTVKQAKDRIRTDPGRGSYYLFVRDRESGRLQGVVTLKELLRSSLASTVNQVMESRPYSILGELAGYELRDHPSWKRWGVLPVVDRSGVFLGTLRLRELPFRETEERQVEPDSSLLSVILPLMEFGVLAFHGIFSGMFSDKEAERVR